MTPAGTQDFPLVADPFSTPTVYQVEERNSGNPFLQPEVAYEWSYGIVYSPKWLKGLTVSADWWHIHLRSVIFDFLGAQFFIEHNSPPKPPAVQNGPLVFRAPSSIPGMVGPVTLVIYQNSNFHRALHACPTRRASYISHRDFLAH